MKFSPDVFVAGPGLSFIWSSHIGYIDLLTILFATTMGCLRLLRFPNLHHPDQVRQIHQ
jgi:hypothetical protein